MTNTLAYCSPQLVRSLSTLKVDLFFPVQKLPEVFLGWWRCSLPAASLASSHPGPPGIDGSTLGCPETRL
jgi:hypothetical protein